MLCLQLCTSARASTLEPDTDLGVARPRSRRFAFRQIAFRPGRSAASRPGHHCTNRQAARGARQLLLVTRIMKLRWQPAAKAAHCKIDSGLSASPVTHAIWLHRC